MYSVIEGIQNPKPFGSIKTKLLEFQKRLELILGVGRGMRKFPQTEKEIS